MSLLAVVALALTAGKTLPQSDLTKSSEKQLLSQLPDSKHIEKKTTPVSEDESLSRKTLINS